MRMQLEPSISWGDLCVATGLMITGVLAFTDVSNGVAVNEMRLQHVSSDLNMLNEEFREHLTQERADRQLMREEVREDLALIMAKIDRLIERDLEGK